MTNIVHLTGTSHDDDEDNLNVLTLHDLEAEIAAVKNAPEGAPRNLTSLIMVFDYTSDQRDLNIDYDPNAPRPTRETEEIIPSENAIMANDPEEDDDEPVGDSIPDDDDGTDFGGTEEDEDDDFTDEDEEEDDEDGPTGPTEYNLYGMCTLDADAMVKLLLDDGDTVEGEKKRMWWVQHDTVFQLDMESSESTQHSTYNFTKDELPGLAAAFRAPPNGFTSKPTPVYFNSWGVASSQKMIVMHTVAPSPHALPKDHYAYRDDEQIEDMMAGHLRVTIMDINGVNSTLVPHAVALAIASQIDKLHALI